MKTITLVEDPDTGELIMPIPDDMWEKLGWQIGDTLTWTVKTNGTIILSKKADND